jgi:hypothetical protein
MDIVKQVNNGVTLLKTNSGKVLILLELLIKSVVPPEPNII